MYIPITIQREKRYRAMKMEKYAQYQEKKIVSLVFKFIF